MFTVEWLEQADQELASLWVSAPSEWRKPITFSVKQLERDLKFSAATLGESRGEHGRIAFEGSLGVLFYVRDRQVTVYHVWFCPPRA